MKIIELEKSVSVLQNKIEDFKESLQISEAKLIKTKVIS